ncbi:MAG: hypothetical protein EZS28_026825 [Streblomastix strix]|uniref:B30.2/SPRY domain-containing protein n=1 Tax=Streblomastix strix TaxID=222440 RepID=A0A5J4V4I6_9EUKA|nr:MAG: hypothetical protein EZS28_026825 [Streblomastix strix]
MTEESLRNSKGATYNGQNEADDAVIISRLIADLVQDNAHLYVPALKLLLDIVLNHLQSKDLVLPQKIIPLLKKFSGNVDGSEEFVLCATILQVVGARCGTQDKTLLAYEIIYPLIQLIHSNDEKQSKSGSKALEELIGENEIIRNSLLQSGFIYIVQRAFALETGYSTFVKSGLLDIVLKLLLSADELDPLASLIPTLEQLKICEHKLLKKQAINILALLNVKGINASQSMQVNNEDLQREIIRERRRADEAEEKITRLELEIQRERFKTQEFAELTQRSEQEKVRKEEELLIMKSENEQLKEQYEILKSKQSQDFPIAIINPDPLEISFSDINGIMKKISKKQDKYNTVSISQVLENGIWSMEAEFKNTKIYATIGIVEDSFNIPPEAYPWNEPSSRHMVVYTSKEYGGSIWQRGKAIDGNTKFKDNQIVRLELDCEKGTLFFFLDDIQQPLYISGIKEKVRFVIFMYYTGATCVIRSLKKLAGPSTVHVAQEREVSW